MESALAGKVALITAAGSGMGAAIARKLADLDYQIAILSSSGRGEALANELGGIGVTGSNQNPADLVRLVANALTTFGGIDAVINSAGHGPKGEILEFTDDDWHLAMDVYLLNVIRLARLVTPTMKSRGGGAIINISTFAACEPDPVFPTSSTMRAALATFTKLFADEYAANNIRMNNVLPGFIDSLPKKKRDFAIAFRWVVTGQRKKLRGRSHSCYPMVRLTSPAKIFASTVALRDPSSCLCCRRLMTAFYCHR